MTTNESSASRILFSLTPVNNEWFRAQRDTNAKLTQLALDLADGAHTQFWESFCEYAGITNMRHKPTNLAIVAILSLDKDRRDKLGENLEKLELPNEFSYTGAVYDPEGSQCACGQPIYNIVEMVNKRNKVRFNVGIDCCQKIKLLPKDEIKKIKKKFTSDKQIRDNKECEDCGELCIPKEDEAKICDTCAENKKEREVMQRAQEQAEKAQKIQNRAHVGRLVLKMQKHRGKTYAHVLEKDPGYLIFQYERDCWDDDKYTDNPKIREFIEFNLAHRI